MGGLHRAYSNSGTPTEGGAHSSVDSSNRELQGTIHQAEGLGVTLCEVDDGVARAQDAVHERLGIAPHEPLAGMLGLTQGT